MRMTLTRQRSKTIQLRTISRSFEIDQFPICMRGVHRFFCACVRSLNHNVYVHLWNNRKIKCRMISTQHFINEAPDLASPSPSLTTGRVSNHTTHFATLMNRTWMPALIYANQSQTKSSAWEMLKIMLMWVKRTETVPWKTLHSLWGLKCIDTTQQTVKVTTFHVIWFTFEVSLIKIWISTRLSLFYVQTKETLWMKITVSAS